LRDALGDIAVKCPGQDTRFWKPDDIFDVVCPACGKPVEFFKDDPSRRCPKCGTLIANPRLDRGCAEWCRYARECPALRGRLENGSQSIRERLISAMREFLGPDEPRIAHTLKVLEYAEEILKVEKASPLVVRAAAILHDIGVPEAERKYGSSAARYQEIEGPPIARRIMRDVGLDETTIDKVLSIVESHHSGRDIDAPEFNIVWDSDRLANIPEEFASCSRKELKSIIEKVFKTETGKKKAYELFIEKGKG